MQPDERSFAMYQPFLSVLELEVPVVGALAGHAIGGGLGLALVCDLRVASADAKYGANFTRLGLHPGMATTYLLPRIVGVPRAAELLLTGRLIDGAEAERMGLVNYALPAGEVQMRSSALEGETPALRSAMAQQDRALEALGDASQRSEAATGLTVTASGGPPGRGSRPTPSRSVASARSRSRRSARRRSWFGTTRRTRGTWRAAREAESRDLRRLTRCAILVPNSE